MRKIIFMLLLAMVLGGCVSKQYQKHEEISKVMIGEGYPIVFAKAAANGVLNVSTLQCEAGNPTVCIPYSWLESPNGQKKRLRYICYKTDAAGRLNKMFDAGATPPGHIIGKDFTEKDLSCGTHECKDYLSEEHYRKFWADITR